MKKKFIYTFALLAVILLSQCGPTMQDAIDYNDELIAEETDVIDKINDLDVAMNDWDNPAGVKLALDAAKTQLDKSMKAVETMGDFDGNSEFINSCLDLFKVFKSQLNDEYQRKYEIIKIYNETPEKYTTVEENEYNNLNTQLDDEYYPAFDRFSKAQEDFAAEWGFTLDYSESY